MAIIKKESREALQWQLSPGGDCPSRSEDILFHFQFPANGEKEVSMKNKERKNKWLRSLIGYLLLIVMIVAVIPAVPSEASAKSVALTKYRQLLSKKRISVIPQGKRIMGDDYREIKYYSSEAKYVKFSIAYIDGDDVPELILRDSRYGFGVWTYKGGSFRCLQWKDFYDFPVGYYKKKGVFRINATTEGSPFYREYYKLQTGKKAVYIQTQSCFDGDADRETLNEWNGFYIGNSKKKVSSSAFYKNLKKYVGSTKMTQIYMHNNTQANRKKYIK